MVEIVAAAVERSLGAVPGTRVTSNVKVRERGTKRLRQLDVLVEVPTKRRMLRVGIEVRDRKTPVDIKVVEGLIAKLLKLEIDKGCIVSRAGFSESAAEAAAAAGIEARTMAEIAHPDWWRIVNFEVHRIRLELVSTSLDFNPADVAAARELVQDQRMTAIISDSPLGGVETVTDMVLRHASAIELPSDVVMMNEALDITLDMSEAPRWTTPLGPLPPLRRVRATFRPHRTVEEVPLIAFRDSDAVVAFAGLSEDLGGQITVVVTDQLDGSKSVSFNLDLLDKTER